MEDLEEGVGTLYHVAVQVEGPDPLKVRDIQGEVAKLLRWRYDGELSTEMLGRDLFISFVFETDPVDPSSELEEIVEVLAHSVWTANGEFCPLQIGTGVANQEDMDMLREFGEDEYEELMKEGS